MSRKTKAFLFTKNCCGMFWTTKFIMWVRCLNPFCVDKWIINNLPLPAHTKTLYKREKVICLNARVGCLSPFMSIQIQSYSYWFSVARILQKSVLLAVMITIKTQNMSLRKEAYLSMADKYYIFKTKALYQYPVFKHWYIYIQGHVVSI